MKDWSLVLDPASTSVRCASMCQLVARDFADSMV